MLPLYIECQRCHGLKRVAKPSIQAKQRYCSHHCANAAHPISRAAASRGGVMRAHRARLGLMLRVAQMTPVEAFRAGYIRGLQSKWRKTAQLRKAS